MNAVRALASDREPHAPAPAGGIGLLRQAGAKLGLSARAHARILKLARTIVDLAARPALTAAHLSEAIQDRKLDRGAG